MGNGCCNEDRHYQQSLPQNAQLQSIVSATKDVESSLPKLEKESNRTRQTLNYLCGEAEAVSGDLSSVAVNCKPLREEVLGYHSEAQNLVSRACGRDLPVLRGPRKRTIVRSKTSVMEGQERDSGTKETPDGLLDIELTLKSLEIAHTEVKSNVEKIAAMRVRLSKAKSQLEINVLNSIQTLSAEIDNLHQSKGQLLNEGSQHDDAIVKLGQTAKPSDLLARLSNLQKEMGDMMDLLETTGIKADSDLSDIEAIESEMKEVLLSAAELITGLKNSLGSSPPSVVPEPSKPIKPDKYVDKQREDFFQSKLQEMSSALTAQEDRAEAASNDMRRMRERLQTAQDEVRLAHSKLQEMSSALSAEENKARAATSDVKRMRERLEMTQEGVKLAHTRMILFIGKLWETRAMQRVVRVWRVGIEAVKLQEAEERHSTGEVRNEKMSNRRKFTRLMQILEKHYLFLRERYFQRFHKARISLTLKQLAPSVPYRKVLKIQVKGLVSSVERYRLRLLKQSLSRIRITSKAAKGVQRLRFVLARLVKYLLLSGFDRLRLTPGAEGVGLELAAESHGLMTAVPEFDARALRQDSRSSQNYAFEPASEDDIEQPIMEIYESNPAFHVSSKSVSESEFPSGMQSPFSEESNVDEQRRSQAPQARATRMGSVTFSRPSVYS